MSESVSKEASSEPMIDLGNSANAEIPKISKNQQKRLLREARRKETKSEWRKLQKAKRKLKEQTKKDECIAEGICAYYCIFILCLY